MKELTKKWLITIILIVTVLLIAIFIIYQQTEQGVGTAGISKSEFEEIRVGETTIWDLNSIIDKNNEWQNDEIYNKCVKKIKELKEGKKYTYVYKYHGEKSGYAIITLQADYSNGYFYNDVIVIKKEKFDLK